MPSLAFHRSSRRCGAAAVLAAIALGACGADDARLGASDTAAAAAATRTADSTAERQRTVRVLAGERDGRYFFRAPKRLARGTTLFKLRNVGQETHQLALARLAPGVTPDEAIAANGGNGTATILGEVVATPGGTGELLARLKKGRHLVLCFEEVKGRPHHELGQRATFTVR